MIHEQSISMNMKAEEIIQEAITALGKQPGIRVRTGSKGSGKGKRDKEQAIFIKTGKEELEFAVELRNEIRMVHLPLLLEKRAGQGKEHWLLVSQYIPKPMKEDMKNQGINYLEASGNCFIRQGALFLLVNDQPVSAVRMPEQGKLWKHSGLKFLFLILQHPQLINAPYRTIAKASGIALGNIGSLIDELKKEGYAKADANGQLHIDQLQQLENKWVELFAAVLLPKLRKGRFRFAGVEGIKADWKKIPANQFLWGGESAGAILTRYLQPEKLTLYSTHSRMDLMKALKLVPDDKGPVELLEQFWDDEDLVYPGKESRTVPPLLAYAELATSMDSRNRETAERIRNLSLHHD